MPTAYCLLPSLLLSLSGEGSFAEAGQAEFSFHSLTIGRACINNGSLDLTADFEGEFDLFAFDRPGQIGLAEDSLISDGQILAFLFESERGGTGARFGLHVKSPGPCDIDFSA